MNLLRLRAQSLAAVPSTSNSVQNQYMDNMMMGRLAAVVAEEGTEAEQWRPVANLKEESQLDQLARIYRCFVFMRTDAHVLLNCIYSGIIRCQFKLLFLRKERKLFAKGQHNHAQTSPLLELPMAAISTTTISQQPNSQPNPPSKPKGKRARRMKGWKFLRELGDERELRQFGQCWKSYGQRKQIWYCPRRPGCRYRMCWLREECALYESGEHRHHHGEEGKGGGRGEVEEEGGGAKKRGNLVEIMPKKKRGMENARENGEGMGASSAVGTNESRGGTFIRQIANPNKHLLIMAQLATPPYKLGVGTSAAPSSSAYEALTPENAEEDGGGDQLDEIIVVDESGEEEEEEEEEEGDGGIEEERGEAEERYAAAATNCCRPKPNGIERGGRGMPPFNTGEPRRIYYYFVGISLRLYDHTHCAMPPPPSYPVVMFWPPGGHNPTEGDGQECGDENAK